MGAILPGRTSDVLYYRYNGCRLKLFKDGESKVRSSGPPEYSISLGTKSTLRNKSTDFEILKSMVNTLEYGSRNSQSTVSTKSVEVIILVGTVSTKVRVRVLNLEIRRVR